MWHVTTAASIRVYEKTSWISSWKKETFQMWYCHYSCSQKDTMKTHVESVHEENKPFKCTIWGKLLIKKETWQVIFQEFMGERSHHLKWWKRKLLKGKAMLGKVNLVGYSLLYHDFTKGNHENWNINANSCFKINVFWLYFHLKVVSTCCHFLRCPF